MDLRCSENRTTSDYHHYSIHSIIFCCTECKTKLRSVLPGALFTSIIWLVGSFLFGWYISNFGNYNKTYGSLAGIIILFLWLYITSFIIIIGAEINAIIHQRKVIKGHTPEEAALPMMTTIKIIIMKTQLMNTTMTHLRIKMKIII